MAYKVGDHICDMHDGFKYLDKSFTVIDNVRIRTDSALALVNRLTNDKYSCNKYLAIVAIDDGIFTCAYSYDARYLGIVTLHHHDPKES